MSSSNASSDTTSSSPGDDTLDLCGEVCPYTFVRTRLRLEAMPLDAVLTVVVDFQPATVNIPRSAREWGQDVLDVTSTGAGQWHIRLRKRVE